MKPSQNTSSGRLHLRIPGWVAILLALTAITVLTSACAPAVAAAGAQAGAASLPTDMTISQADEKRSQGAFILDVRQPDEWNQVHIPGATLIPLGELSNRLKEVPKDREVVVVCRSGNRSQQGRDILRSAGYTRVTSMAGGVVQWQAQGLPVVSGP